MQAQARCLGALPGGAGVVRQALRIIPGPAQVHGFAPVVQVQGSLHAVTAVVAGSAGDPDTPCVRRHGQCQLRHRQSGALHQHIRRQVLHRGLLDAARAGGVVQGAGLGKR